MCNPTDVTCKVGEGFQNAVTDQFDEFIRRTGEMAASGLQAVATFWLRVDSPTLTTMSLRPNCTPDREDSCEVWTDSAPVSFLHDHLSTLALSIFVLSMVVAGTRTAWEQRAEPLRDFVRSTLLFVVVSGAGTATIQLLAAWSDDLALRIVQDVAPTGRTLDYMIGGALMAAVQQLPAMAMMFFALAVFIASLIQVILLLIRSAMLVLLVGTFPLAAAATNTEVGKAWVKKYCAWALA